MHHLRLPLVPPSNHHTVALGGGWPCTLMRYRHVYLGCPWLLSTCAPMHPRFSLEKSMAIFIFKHVQHFLDGSSEMRSAVTGGRPLNTCLVAAGSVGDVQ